MSDFFVDSAFNLNPRKTLIRYQLELREIRWELLGKECAAVEI